MDLTLKNFRNIKIQEIEPGNFVDKDRWTESTTKLEELKSFIDEMLRIINSKQQIPENLKFKGNEFANIFLTLIKGITEETKGQPEEIVRHKKQALNEIDGFYKVCIEKVNQRPEQLSFFETFNTLKNIEKYNYENEQIEINNLKSKISADKDSIDTILKELQKKSTSITMSDYAKVFGDESDTHYQNSWIWLLVGIGTSLLFFILLLFTDIYSQFPTEEVLADGQTVKYNVSNLLIKLLIFAVQIFLISFSFKQYSISRHLKTINKHRQNGLDSFKLFVESISKDDRETRNSLMLQLAKSIYEQTATGYIGDKGQNVNSGIVEITKMIGANKIE